jgi:hypothetical protein
MGESWMVDGETSVMMMAMISSKSLMMNGVSGSESRFLVVAAQQNSIWDKRPNPRCFQVRGYM